MYVQEIGNPEPLIAFAADEPRQPASTMKVLTTLAALEELGPSYQWKTEVWSSAPVRDGKLDGDLYLKGEGDPYLVIEHFWRLLRQIRQDEITTVGGDLVLDRSYFAPEPEDPGDFDGRPNRAYNVEPSALLVNFQAVDFTFLPDLAANRVRVVADPWPAQLTLENDIRLKRTGCRGSWGRDLGLRTTQKAGKDIVTLSGYYSAACGAHSMFRVVSDPLPYIQGVFKTLWNEMGGHFDGGVREGNVPADAQLIAAIESPPLAEVIRSVNKFSNNVMTRQLLLTLGAHQAGAPGTTQKGIAAVRSWMQQRGLEFPELVLENGSGLSRTEQISARHMAAVLRAGYESPSMPEYLASFPISGQDGTMRHRLAGTPLEGRIHIKTGSINNVRAVAGYVLDRQNRRVVVVILHNGPQAENGMAEVFQNAVLEWVYSRP